MDKPLHSVQSTLTDSEWVSLINKERGGLPECCGNISELRDRVIALAREGGLLPAWDSMMLLRAYRVARDGHDFTEEEHPALLKLVREVAEASGYTLEQIHEFPHEGNGEV